MKAILKMKVPVALLLAIIIVFTSCNASRTTKGGAIGAGAGAVLGGVIGNRTGSTAGGAIIGAAVGGAAGALIGRYMDKQAAELERDLKGAEVERIGEGIKVTFDSGILFAFDSDNLSSQSQTNLNNLANTLKKYGDTELLIEGHTDNKGDASYNQKLSERRAQSVARKLKDLGVQGSRLTTKGYGFNQPVASNDSESGRAQNRRVELAIYANDKLKDKAKDGELKL
jgi:outer membrane protein OmpA-like peptidoglycan-associated protein